MEPDELYDEGADDADEAWVNRHYRKSTSSLCDGGIMHGSRVGVVDRQITKPVLTDHLLGLSVHAGKEATRGGTSKGPETDAVLNCPCCFTTLCMDCQR